MKQLVFASGNQHKIQEIQNHLGLLFHIKSMREIGFIDEIPETGLTLSDNAKIKAQCIYDRFKVDCFADDTGLEVEALDGAPGVFSARYAGEGCSFEDNMRKLQENLEGVSNRRARFVTVIHLIFSGQSYQFTGMVEGHITLSYEGIGGFGYDPIFKPAGYPKTFAQMSLTEKNQISHRGIAVSKLVNFLSTQSIP